jgi:hypothetical protein
MKKKNSFKQNTSKEVADNHLFFEAMAGLVGLVIIAIALVFLVEIINKDKPENVAKEERVATTTSQAPDSWQTYKNEDFEFAMQLPKEWHIREQGKGTFFLSNYSKEELSKFGPFEHPSDMNGLFLYLVPTEYGREDVLTKELESKRKRKGYEVRSAPNKNALNAYEIFIDYEKAHIGKVYDITEMLVGNKDRYVVFRNSWGTDNRSQELHNADAEIMRKLVGTFRFYREGSEKLDY